MRPKGGCHKTRLGCVLKPRTRIHNKIEAGICNVCVGDDSVTNLLFLFSTRINCAAPSMMHLSNLFRSTAFSSTRGIDVKDRSSSHLCPRPQAGTMCGSQHKSAPEVFHSLPTQLLRTAQNKDLDNGDAQCSTFRTS